MFFKVDPGNEAFDLPFKRCEVSKVLLVLFVLNLRGSKVVLFTL